MRPTIVGEDNPYSQDPHYALYPVPVNSAGWRLCHRIMNLNKSEYLRYFARVNLCSGAWDSAEAKRNAEALVRSKTLEGAPLVLLGTKVCWAFGLMFSPFSRQGRFTILPHPSGRSRLWNTPEAIPKARALLHDMLEEARGRRSPMS